MKFKDTLTLSLFMLLVLVNVVTESSSEATANSEVKISRAGKLFPVFQIVAFPNNACVGTTKNGTCYTTEECSGKSGKAEGTCADGYGVCCIFERGCGTKVNENCTHFTSSTFSTTEACTLEICPCGDNICQLRLDFVQFAITGPSTDVNSLGWRLFDHQTQGTTDITNFPQIGVQYVEASRCMTDHFSVTNPGGISPPTICGVNTGEHMYVDASKCCNDLSFSFLGTGVGTTALTTRSFDIKITQYSCDYNNLAPPGCTQYFYGSNTGMVQTYNFDGNDDQHLADQIQNICIRRENGNCRICWVATMTGTAVDFGTNSNDNPIDAAGVVGRTNPNQCCGYGGNGMQSEGYDCVSIPGAEKTDGTPLVGDRICGAVGLVTAQAQTASTTVCSTQTPFNVVFISDDYEGLSEQVDGSETQVGFRLAYVMDSINCPTN